MKPKARRRVLRLRGRRQRGARARAALHVQRVCRGFLGRRRAAARKKAAKLDIWWAARQGLFADFGFDGGRAGARASQVLAWGWFFKARLSFSMGRNRLLLFWMLAAQEKPYSTCPEGFGCAFRGNPDFPRGVLSLTRPSPNLEGHPRTSQPNERCCSNIGQGSGTLYK